MRAVVFLLVSSAVLVGCGAPTTLAGKMEHAEDSGRAAENALDEAEKKMEALDAEGAQSSLEEAREKLSDPNISKYPEHGLLKERLEKDTHKLEDTRKEIAKRELEKAVLNAKQLLSAASERLDAALAQLNKPGVSKAHVEETEDAEKELADRLSDSATLETKDAELATFADAMRKKMTKTRDEVGRVNKILAFRSGPGASRIEGASLATEARANKDAEDSFELRSKAIAKYQSCVVDGKEMLVRTPELAKTKMELDGQGTLAAEAIVTSCQKELDALVKKQEAAKKAAAKSAAKTASSKSKSKKPSKKKR